MLTQESQGHQEHVQPAVLLPINTQIQHRKVKWTLQNPIIYLYTELVISLTIRKTQYTVQLLEKKLVKKCIMACARMTENCIFLKLEIPLCSRIIS